jgi:hypothetical protein
MEAVTVGMNNPFAEEIPASRKLHAEVPPSKHARGRLPKKSRRERHADKIARRERIRAALDAKAMNG